MRNGLNIDTAESRKVYSVHGERVVVSGTGSAVVAPISHFMRYFESSPVDKSSGLHIRFFSVTSPQSIPISIPPLADRIATHTTKTFGGDLIEAWQCDVYARAGILTVDLHRKGRLQINYPEGTGQGYLMNPESVHSDILTSYFHFVLSELLKGQGLYTIHATALEKSGRGVLIPGYSGRGKTTACISLLRSGYRCLSDDHPLLKIENGMMEVLAFPEKVDVTENSLKFFPELRENSRGKIYQGLLKRYFHIEDFFSEGTGKSCDPALLIFPQVVNRATSYVERVSKREALEEILPHGLLVYEKTIARKEFQALSHLIRKVDSYRLYFGRDVLELHRVIDPLLS
ncbi:MAG: hypothetical protein R3B74_16900 [Nitrospirales bacterium]|nr:hypothetical protein [Nitrospirales bacterium]